MKKRWWISLFFVTDMIAACYPTISCGGGHAQQDDEKQNKTDPITNDNIFKYVLNEDGKSYTLTTNFDNTIYRSETFDKNVNIPAYHPIDNKPIIAIGDDFLSGCVLFNQPISIPGTVEIIGESFMHNCSSFNADISIPNSVKQIGFAFLQGCSRFDQPLTIPKNLNSIPESFLYDCTNFNQPLTLPNNVIKINGHFLQNCSHFNQPLTIPNSVESIGISFLNSCENFNSSLEISSNLTTIGDYFLSRCSAFNKPLTIPHSATSIGKAFMYNNKSFADILTINCPVDSFKDSINTCATDDKNAPCYLNGFVVLGDYADDFVEKFKNNSDKSSPYRNLNNASSSMSFLKFTLNNDNESYTVDIDWNNSKYVKETFNKPIIIPESHPEDGKPITKIADDFLLDCTSFDSVIVISSNLQTIGDGFLSNCQTFNRIITIPSSVQTIGKLFLYECWSFDQQLIIPETINYVGKDFFWNCKNFTKDLIINCSLDNFEASEYTCATNDTNALCYTSGINIVSENAQNFIEKFKNSDQRPYRNLKTIFYDFFKFELNDDGTYALSINWSVSKFNKSEFNSEIVIPTYHPKDMKRITKINNFFFENCPSFNSNIVIHNGIEMIGENFLIDCKAFNQPLTLPNSIKTIGSGFLQGCSNFNQTISLPNTIKIINEDFMHGCKSFNQPLTFPKLIETIDDRFMEGCENFNQKLSIPSSIKTIGDNFLANCITFNQALTIPISVESVGESFMYNNKNYCFILTINCPAERFKKSSKTCATDDKNADCFIKGFTIDGKYSADFLDIFDNSNDAPYRKLLKPTYFNVFTYELNYDGKTYTINIDWNNPKYKQTEFNEDVVIPSYHPIDKKPITKIGDGFLDGCILFNSDITIPEGIDTIGDHFMNNCQVFDKPLIIPNSVKNINYSFLSQCKKFNQPLILPNSITTIDSYFMNGCESFNQPLIIPNTIRTIPEYFMNYCKTFNQEIILPQSIENIGDYFLNYCYNFNQPLALHDSIKTIGSDFMSSCYAFSYPLTIPETITSVGKDFMWNSKITILTINCKANVFEDSEYTCTTTEIYAPSYQYGIAITGKYAQDFVKKFPNKLNKQGSLYRKLIIPTFFDFFDYKLNDNGQSYAIATTNWNNSNYKPNGFNEEVIIPLYHPDNGLPITKIDEDFFNECVEFNSNITIPSTIETISVGFLYKCSKFNKAFLIPNSVTTIGDSFLSECTTFNQTLTIPNSITKIGSSFLSGCSNFNQLLTLSNILVTLGSAFLSGCKNFNQPLTLPNLTTISISFLKNCYSFNQPLVIPDSVKTIGNDFMYGCQSFNQTLRLSQTVENIGNEFMAQCWSFDQHLTIPSSVSLIGNNFLWNCKNFHSKILTIDCQVDAFSNDTTNAFICGTNDIEALCYKKGIIIAGKYAQDFVKKFPNMQDEDGPYRKLIIPTYFDFFVYRLNSDGKSYTLDVDWSQSKYKKGTFNEEIVIPGYYPIDGTPITKIATNFLENCDLFNKTITLSNNLQTIGSDFLYSCNAFNQPLIIPESIETIESGFLSNCLSFDQPLTIPNNVTKVASAFMWNCKNFHTRTLIIDCPAKVFEGSVYTCAGNEKNAISYQSGIIVGGKYAQDFVNRFKNSDESPFRKLIAPIHYDFLEFKLNATGESYTISTDWTNSTYSIQDFNSEIIIPAYYKDGKPIAAIANGFLNNCSSFDNNISIPQTVKTIGDYFLGHCSAYTKPLVLLETIETIGDYFMCN